MAGVPVAVIPMGRGNNYSGELLLPQNNHASGLTTILACRTAIQMRAYLLTPAVKGYRQLQSCADHHAVGVVSVEHIFPLHHT